MCVALARRLFQGDSRIRVERLSGYVDSPILRIKLYGPPHMRELTIACDEVDAVAPWIAGVLSGARDFTDPLPVPECTRSPWWRGNYRWTAAADALATERERGRAA